MAQLVARFVRIEEVRSSNLLSSTVGKCNINTPCRLRQGVLLHSWGMTAVAEPRAVLRGAARVPP